MPVIRIEHLEDSRLDDYRNVPDAELLRRRGLFVGEGRLVSRRLLRGRHRVVSLLVNEPSLKSLEDDLAGVIDEIPIYVCSTPELAGIVGFNFHRGCLALVERPSELEAADVVRDAKLLLVKLLANPCDRQPKDVPLTVFFPDQSGPVLAKWFSGEFLVSLGRRLQDLYLFEHYLLITVERGIVINRRESRERPQ